jgi:hypothetical protein
VSEPADFDGANLDHIVSMTRHGCGCTVTTFESGLVEHEPCLPCALHAAGAWLQKAADAMRRERGQ